MKVLVLILSSPNVNPVYKLHKEIWGKYMNSHPDISCFFMEYTENTENAENAENAENTVKIQVKDNHIFINGKESVIPGCYNKTLDSLEYFINNNVVEYDFIIRTNLSSLWNFRALIKHLETLPREKLYYGAIGYSDNVKFASGSGFIITPDVAKILLKNRNLGTITYYDDVAIAEVLYKLNIHPTKGYRKDYYSLSMYEADSTYDDSVYHYRIKCVDLNRDDEYKIMLGLLSKF